MTHTRRFENAAASVPAARHFATEVLRGTPTDALEAIELMVSELASNCVRHAGSSFRLTIIREHGAIRVEALDAGAGEPAMRSPRPVDPSGRGLLIIDMLSTEWGLVAHGEAGKTVWFTLDVAPSPV